MTRSSAHPQGEVSSGPFSIKRCSSREVDPEEGPIVPIEQRPQGRISLVFLTEIETAFAFR